MNDLEQSIRQRIITDGPMPVAEYMSLCLTHPQHGYYTTSQPVTGRAASDRTGGDFITAPEVSQMFGELIAVWCMEVWQSLGQPNPFSLVELGPGRGTLMRDLLGVAGALPGFLEAAQIHLVEISPTLAEQQSRTLSSSTSNLRWVPDIGQLPDQPTIMIANEFLDALPFRQWVKMESGWVERAVGLSQGKLAFVARPNVLDEALLPKGHEAEPPGMIFETAPAREAHIAMVAEKLVQCSGAALYIDYGHTSSGFGDTFQAVRNHAYADVLVEPGMADLTSHVDFQPLIKQAADLGCTLPEPVTQSQFLLSLGLLERAGNLGAGRSTQIQNMLHDAVERLAGPDQMGDLFKVMAFGSPPSLSHRWPGF